MDEMQINPTTYIKSNIATVKNFMSFLSALLFVIVAGITAYVILSYKDTRENRFEMSNEFHFELKEGSVTVLEFLDQKATECEIPASVKYGSRTYPITTIAENAFTNNSVLTEITIPDSVTAILGNAEESRGAFSGCTALKTVNIGNGVTHIGAFAFKNCVVLNEITIPANVQFVSDYAFQNCLALETIQLDGNGPLDENTFENCLYVKTLKLADGVKLNDNARKSLSKLTRLENLVISDAHQFYKYDAENNCLLTKTESENDTLVLAGISAKVPASVTQIIDWSFGERTPELIYVPSSVKTVAENAFNKNAICTSYVDKASIPSGWKISMNTNDGNPVYTNAKLCTFNANGIIKTAYVYNDSKGQVLPKYADLFPNVKNPMPFKKWVDAGGLTYNAKYEIETKGGYGHELYDAIVDAAFYVENNLNKEMYRKFKIDFWQDYKALFYEAKKIYDNLNNEIYTYDYITQYVIAELNKKTAVVDAVDKSQSGYDQYLESNDWQVGLLELINVIDALEVVDASESCKEEMASIKTMSNNASIAYKAGEHTFLPSVWLDLRMQINKITVSVDENSALRREIVESEKVLKNRHLYTKKTWRRLADCLEDAYEVTEHSLTISKVRQALKAARENLHEVGFEDDMIRLQTWISICEDLNVEDYEEKEFETLKGDVNGININSLGTRSAINQKFDLLFNDYNNLKLIEYVPEAEPTIININTLPYFIIAVVLFTGAVVAGSYAFTLKRQMRRKK